MSAAAALCDCRQRLGSSPPSRRVSLANPLAERGGDLHKYSDGKPARTAGCAASEDAEAERQHERSRLRI